MSALGTKGQNRHSARRRQRDSEQAAESWNKNPRYQAKALMAILEAHWDGRKELSASQIKAVEIALDRVLPRLSAIEQTNLNEQDMVSEDQIIGAIESIVAQRPELVDHLVMLRDKQRQAEQNAAASSPSTQ